MAKCMVCDGSAILDTNQKGLNHWVPCLYCDGSGKATKKHIYALCDKLGLQNQKTEKQKAFDRLFKAGIIDSDGKLTEHYRS